MFNLFLFFIESYDTFIYSKLLIQIDRSKFLFLKIIHN